MTSVTAQDASAKEPANDILQTGKHFTLHYHGGDEALAERALAVVEATWTAAATQLGKPDAMPKRVLAVHLYRTIAAYEAAEQQISGGKFRRNLAMTDSPTRSAHVAVQPPCRDEVLRAVGLPGQTVALLAWEATHLVRLEILGNDRDPPAWFVDGFAALVAGNVLVKQCGASGIDATPFTANAMTTAQDLLRDKKLPAAAAILADRIDDLDFGPRYATRTVFLLFLASDTSKGRLAKVVDIMAKVASGPKDQPEVASRVSKLLGATLDKDFAAFVAKCKPRWSEVFRSLSPVGEDWQQIAFPAMNAIAWNTEPSRGGALRVSGSMRILPGDKQQLNFLFARTGKGFYSIGFTADHGFTVFDYESSNEAWNRIGSAEAPSLRLGYTSSFAIEAKGSKLTVHLDNQQWDFILPRALPADVSWGLGAQNASAGLWQGIKVAGG